MKSVMKSSVVKAPIAVAIIAKDVETKIGACVDSLVPYVEEVVVVVDKATKDRTAKVARQHGAKVVLGLEVSEWHECPAHGKVKAQNFAKARDFSFRLLRQDIPWLMWVDADDVVEGGENLAKVVSDIPDQVAAIWLPYHYSRANGTGPTTTLFDRERILRRSVGWHWEHRVHEVAVPDCGAIETVAQARTDRVRIIHQDQGHDTEGSAKRNILLSEIEIEEEPRWNMRNLFYLGNQYFALGMYDASIYYYTQSLESENVHQVWQSWIYLSMAYEHIGDVDNAKSCAYHALDLIPYHPEPWLRLAVIRGLIPGDVEACEFFTKLGRSMRQSPSFMFKNPVDVDYNSSVALAQTYQNAGYIGRTVVELEKAVSVIAHPSIVGALEQNRKLLSESQSADSFLRLNSVGIKANTVGSQGEYFPYRSREEIPDSLWKFGRVRDAVVPKVLHQRSQKPTTQPRAIIWCGASVEPWAPLSLNSTGIGGSETAVVEIAKRLCADGWLVDVYNEPGSYEGEYDGVGYWGLNRLGQGEHAELLISWRNPGVSALPIERKMSLLWCHDLNKGPSVMEDMARWDRVLGVSLWHADYLRRVYSVDGARVGFVPNGIDLVRFKGQAEKVPFRCVYASSPDRGLVTLLQMWPRIAAVDPTAELHVAYGWETIDKYIAMGHTQLLDLKQQVMELINKTPGVVWCGRLPQDKLAELYKSSYCWLYPTTFLEVSCISAMESMAAGCVPVTSAAGALPGTIGSAGVIVTGNAYTEAWKEYYVHCAKAALASPQIRLPLATNGIQRAKMLTWDKAYEDHWKPLVVGLLEQREVAA